MNEVIQGECVKLPTEKEWFLVMVDCCGGGNSWFCLTTHETLDQCKWSVDNMDASYKQWRIVRVMLPMTVRADAEARI